MKKKLLAGIMAGTMMMSMLAGCGGNASDNSSATSATAENAENNSASTAANENTKSGEGYSMTLILSSRTEFLGTLEQAAKEKADEYNVKLTTQDANSDTNKLLQYIESSVTAGEDAILVNPIDSETGQAIIDAAQGVPVVFCNIAPADLSILNKSATMVASDNLEAGQRQAQFIADKCKEEGKTEINYIMMEGTLGMIHTEQRTEGCLNTLEELGITCNPAAAPLVGEYDRATAMDQISPLVGTTDFDTIICNNDAMALGCIEALKAKNLDPKDYTIVGVDCTADGAQAVADGEMSMTVFQDPEGQGLGSVQVAINMIEGKPLTDNTEYELAEDNEFVVWVPFQTVTAENVSDFM